MLRGSKRKPNFEIQAILAISYEASAKNTQNFHESGTAARFKDQIAQSSAWKKHETFFKVSFPRRQLHVLGCALSKASRVELILSKLHVGFIEALGNVRMLMKFTCP